MPAKVDTILYDVLVKECGVDAGIIDGIRRNKPGISGRALLYALTSEHLIDETAVLKRVAVHIGVEFRSIRHEVIDPTLFKRIPLKVASHYQFVPLRLEEKILTIGIAYPLDIGSQDAVRFQLGYHLRQVLVPAAEIADLLQSNYGLGAQTIEQMVLRDGSKAGRAQAKAAVENIEQRGDDDTVSNLVNQIIFDAYKKRATDIHIEPYRSEVRFRYRIDGVLYDAKVSPEVKHLINPILSRIKIISNLDIVEHRLPQDGQATVTTSDQRLDLRISCIPTPYGESVVVRILPSVAIFQIEKLGLSPEDKRDIESLLSKPNGIIFVTGPTGSGKTTTLYACLNQLNTKDRKIITIEDPIEYEIGGVTQIQVNSQIGLDFAAGLRSILRHDPDVIMVGEVRDLETAEIAIRVALTGHLVFSTLHTNSAAASVHRLLDIGIAPYLIYSSTIAFIAQRLIRNLCPKCKVVDENPDISLERFIRNQLAIPDDQPVQLHKKAGCDHCNQTGYFGRSAIYEIIFIDDAIRDLIHRRASSQEIERAALQGGMRTLMRSGLQRVVQGVTSMEEILHILPVVTIKSVKSPGSVDARTQEKIKNIPEDTIVDRRVYLRANRRYPITFSIYKMVQDSSVQARHEAGISENDYWHEHQAFTDNISAGGLIFSHRLAMTEQTILHIKITLPMDVQESLREITCLAKVARADASEVNNFYRVAVYFLDMSSSDQKALDHYLAATEAEDEKAKQDEEDVSG